ncbi:MAG: serine/threonine protein kinase [Planctomycetes bacterium]|nr:serine/threonine protein kinase [Planctomycetota bacterium]
MVDETITFHVEDQAAATTEAIEIPRRIGNVRIGRMIGEGAGGVVFAGFDDAIRRNVAVKVLHARRDKSHQAAIAELAGGVQSAGRIKHPNIVTVHSVESAGGLPAIVMEYIDGISLREALLRSGRLDFALAMFITHSITSAVAAMHAENVVHRDIKPANILFDRNGEAHVCDFGLAIEFDTLRRQGTASNVGGSPLYMAPEMFEGQVSPQSDVYALGILLFELLSGQPPFEADTITDMKARHVSAVVPTQRLEMLGVPEAVREIVERALHKQRVMRFKTAGHMLRSLEAAYAADQRPAVLKSRIAAIVGAQQQTRETNPDATPLDHPAMTTFDLVAEHARRKRQMRDS